METGTPYMLYKDACNAKSNQQHLGTIACSNLCCEIVEYADADEVAVCNLGSLVLPRFVRDGALDLDELRRVAGVLATNLDATIDAGAYPDAAAERSNKRHRPIGVGVQGLADALALLRLPFDSPEAAALNRDVFEAIYVGCLEASVALAAAHGPHPSFPGSPAARGLLQPDLWREALGLETHVRLVLVLLQLASWRVLPADFHGCPVAARACERSARLIAQAHGQGYILRTVLPSTGEEIRLKASTEFGRLQSRLLAIIGSSLTGDHIAEFRAVTAPALAALPPPRAASSSLLPVATYGEMAHHRPPSMDTHGNTATLSGPSAARALNEATPGTASASANAPSVAIGVPVGAGQRWRDLSESIAARFVPAIVLLQVWAFCLTRATPHAGNATGTGLYTTSVLLDYWPMAIGMVVGSLLGGSNTPVGGWRRCGLPCGGARLGAEPRRGARRVRA